MRLSGALRAFQAFEMNAELIGCLEDFAVADDTCRSEQNAADLIGAGPHRFASDCRCPDRLGPKRIGSVRLARARHAGRSGIRRVLRKRP